MVLSLPSEMLRLRNDTRPWNVPYFRTVMCVLSILNERKLPSFLNAPTRRLTVCVTKEDAGGWRDNYVASGGLQTMLNIGIKSRSGSEDKTLLLLTESTPFGI